MDYYGLTVEVGQEPGHVLITVAGEVDIATAPQLRERLQARGDKILYAELFNEIGLSRQPSIRNCGFFENRLPWAFRFARSTVDTFIRIDVQLVGAFGLVGANVFIDAIDRAHTDASGVQTIDA